MLKRRVQTTDDVADEEIAAVFAGHLQEIKRWLEVQEHMDVFYVEYAAVLSDPLGESAKIKDFLDLPLNKLQMAAVVDESLYRQRQ
jgi:hypothetical protein